MEFPCNCSSGKSNAAININTEKTNNKKEVLDFSRTSFLFPPIEK